jgi:hypothetical protein
MQNPNETRKRSRDHEVNRNHTLRAYFKTLHEVRHEVQVFQRFANEVEVELASDFNDITPAFLMDKVALFLKRLRHIGHCPLSGDAIHELSFINSCGHVFNKISLDAMPDMTKCPLCNEPLRYRSRVQASPIRLRKVA